MNTQSPHKWWSTLKSVVLSSSLSLLPIVGWSGRLVCWSVGKDDLLSDHFVSTSPRSLLICHSFGRSRGLLSCYSHLLITFAFRSIEVGHLLLDLDPYGGTDPLGMFPFLMNRTADVVAPRLSVVFRQLVRLGSFPARRRQAYVTPILKHPPSYSVANYQPISITLVLSKVFERLVSVRLGRFIERSGVLAPKQFAYLRWTRDCSRVNWEEFVRCQVRAKEVYPEAKHQFGVRNIDVLMNVKSPHKWWSTLKSAVFGSSSSLPPLVGPGGGLVCEWLLRLICCQIILTASSPGSLLICWSLAIRLLVQSPLPSGQMRLNGSC